MVTESVIGKKIEVLVCDVYSQDGKVIGIPVVDADRRMAGDEVIAGAMQRFRNHQKTSKKPR